MNISIFPNNKRILNISKIIDGHIARPYAKVLHLVLLAGGSLNACVICNLETVDAMKAHGLFKLKGPAKEVKLAETNFGYAQKVDLILHLNKYDNENIPISSIRYITESEHCFSAYTYTIIDISCICMFCPSLKGFISQFIDLLARKYCGYIKSTSHYTWLIL